MNALKLQLLSRKDWLRDRGRFCLSRLSGFLRPRYRHNYAMTSGKERTILEAYFSIQILDEITAYVDYAILRFPLLSALN